MQELMDRIRKLERWQRSHLLFGILSDTHYDAEKGDEKAIKNLGYVVREIDEYENQNRRYEREGMDRSNS